VRAARFDVAEELLRELLHLPARARIVGVSFRYVDSEHKALTFIVDDPALPEADFPHDCSPTVTHALQWQWNIKQDAP
jgi:hypothetical protein